MLRELSSGIAGRWRPALRVDSDLPRTFCKSFDSDGSLRAFDTGKHIDYLNSPFPDSISMA